MATLQLQWSDFVVYTKKGFTCRDNFFNNNLWERTIPESETLKHRI